MPTFKIFFGSSTEAGAQTISATITESFLFAESSGRTISALRALKELVLLMDALDRTYVGQRERSEAPGLADTFLVSVFRPITLSSILPLRLVIGDYFGTVTKSKEHFTESIKVKDHFGITLGVRGPLYG